MEDLDQPEHLKQWFMPAPWTTMDWEIDLGHDGILPSVVRSPEEHEFDGDARRLIRRAVDGEAHEARKGGQPRRRRETVRRSHSRFAPVMVSAGRRTRVTKLEYRDHGR